LRFALHRRIHIELRMTGSVWFPISDHSIELDGGACALQADGAKPVEILRRTLSAPSRCSQTGHRVHFAVRKNSKNSGKVPDRTASALIRCNEA
jgi:hypothetical protein